VLDLTSTATAAHVAAVLADHDRALFSPAAHVRGTRDVVVAMGNRCELVEHEGAGHGAFTPTNRELVRFLASVGLAAI
jgi:hypothetical protein